MSLVLAKLGLKHVRKVLSLIRSGMTLYAFMGLFVYVESVFPVQPVRTVQFNRTRHLIEERG